MVYLLAGYLLGAGGAGAATAGTIIAFTALQAGLYQPVERLLQVSVELQSSMALFERIFGYLDLEQEITDAPGAVAIDRDEVRGEVTFDSVRVSSSGHQGGDGAPNGHGESRQWVLDGISLRVEPGQLAALVGPSGAGKTTIAALVPRLYDVTEGLVAIDGIDVRQLRLADLAATVGFVSQETFLFQTTIDENLRYGRPSATSEEVVAAARAANIHDRIMELPAGYATLVGERGFGLSIGERQRLSIARTLLHEPRILVLDEATSALDTASERLLQSALMPAGAGPHDAGHRPPAVHHPGRRRDLRDQRGADQRPRHPRGAAGPLRHLYSAVRRAVQRGAHRGLLRRRRGAVGRRGGPHGGGGGERGWVLTAAVRWVKYIASPHSCRSRALTFHFCRQIRSFPVIMSEL